MRQGSDYGTVRVHFGLTRAFLRELDKEAIANYTSRSQYIRLALLDKMKRQNLYDGRPMPIKATQQAIDEDEAEPKLLFGL